MIPLSCVDRINSSTRSVKPLPQIRAVSCVYATGQGDGIDQIVTRQAQIVGCRANSLIPELVREIDR